MVASPLRYGLLAALVLGGLAPLAWAGPRMGLGLALLLLPLAAWPAWLALAHAAAVRRAGARAVLREGARPWWAPLLGGALLRQVVAIPLALLAAWGTGWWLLSQGPAGLAWLAALALAVHAAARAVQRQTGALRPYARLRPVLLAAPPLAAAALTLAWALLLGLGEAPGTLAQRVAAEPRYEGSSALLAAAVDAMAVLNGARAWAIDRAAGEVGAAAALWRVAGVFGQFWLLGGLFAGLLLPAGEARRILRPSDADRAPAAGPGRVALAALVLALLSGATVEALAEAERALGAARPVLAAAPDLPGTPGPAGPAPALGARAEVGPDRTPPGLPTPSALRAALEAERLGDLACPEGTVAGLAALDEALGGVLAARRAEAERAVRAGFDGARARVPAFLDGYYSLTAEYLRTFHLVAGDAQEFLAARLGEELGLEAGFAEVQTALADLAAPLPAETVAARDRLLAACGRLPPDGADLRVVIEAPAALLQGAPAAEAIGLRARLGASGTGLLAGGLAGAVGGKVLAKLVASEAFGLAAEAVGKLAVAKAAGGLGGAAAGAGAGALAGSVVPGLGTTIGAAVGGVIGGLALGVATDYALLRIEEGVSRDAFEAEILAALDAAEAELLASLGD